MGKVARHTLSLATFFPGEGVSDQDVDGCLRADRLVMRWCMCRPSMLNRPGFGS